MSSRRLHHDSAGHVAELLSKAINKHALDDELDALDREKLIYFLRKWGAALRPGRVNEPIELHTLLDSRFWHWQMFHEQRFHQHSTMLQPVGGMDRTVSAFEAQIGESVNTGCIVTALRKRTDGVRVIYQDTGDGSEKILEVDYCICTLPLSVLSHIESDLTTRFQSHIPGLPLRAVVQAHVAGDEKVLGRGRRRLRGHFLVGRQHDAAVVSVVGVSRQNRHAGWGVKLRRAGHRVFAAYTECTCPRCAAQWHQTAPPDGNGGRAPSLRCLASDPLQPGRLRVLGRVITTPLLPVTDRTGGPNLSGG